MVSDFLTRKLLRKLFSLERNPFPPFLDEFFPLEFSAPVLLLLAREEAIDEHDDCILQLDGTKLSLEKFSLFCASIRRFNVLFLLAFSGDDAFSFEL
jgi:hypothetical protein